MLKRRMKYCGLSFVYCLLLVQLHGGSPAEKQRKIFEQMDVNQNGTVSLSEYLEFWRGCFMCRDRNGDAYLDRAEMPKGVIWHSDMDRDGRISALEDENMRKNHFHSINQNEDGLLTLDELYRAVGIQEKRTADALYDTADIHLMRKKIEALGDLTEAPNFYRDTECDEVTGLTPIYFDALKYQGKPTKVFGWLGIPEGLAQPVPGVILVHGGGGTAFRDWVKLWNDHGYAALSIAVEGQTDTRGTNNQKWQQHAWAGPARVGIYGDSSVPLEDQWMYHAVADTILANSLMRSLPEVNAEQIGVMGISWGGVITSTVMGIDDRFAFAIPVYGCGGLSKAQNQYGRTLGGNDLYKQLWDPNLRMARAHMPALWLSWPGDQHFPLDCLSESADLVSGPSLLSLVPGMQHGHRPGWNRPESYAFADSVLATGRPWSVVTQTENTSSYIEARFLSTRTFEKAVLVWTKDLGFTGDRKWVQSSAAFAKEGDEWVASAKIPNGATACFFNLTSGDLIATSRYIDLTL